MIQKIALKILFFLLLFSSFLLGQNNIQLISSTQSTTGGETKGDLFRLIMIVGQPTPVGLTQNSQFQINSGVVPPAIKRPEFVNITPSPPEIVSQSDNLEITAQVSSEIGLAQVFLYYRQGGQVNFNKVEMIRENDLYRGSIPASQVTDRGLEYFLYAEDNEGNANSTPIFGVSVLVPGEGVQNIAVQPSGSEQNAYRLISFPLNLNDKQPSSILIDDLGEYDPTAWRFFALRPDYLNNPDNIYIEFSSIDQIQSGVAYWLIVKEEGRQIDTGSGRTYLTTEAFVLPLHPGWNFIGNPFNFEIPFTNLRLGSGQSIKSLWTYDGNWTKLNISANNKLVPFEGYAVANNSSLWDTLLINPEISEGSNQSIYEREKTVSFLWYLKITAQCQNARDEENLIAVSTNASYYWDDLDDPEPPIIGQYVSLYFPHPEWEKPLINYTSDVRQVFSDGDTWYFEVKSNIEDFILLTFHGLENVPTQYQIWLIDSEYHLSQNLRKNFQYKTTLSKTKRNKGFYLVIGKKDYVDKNISVYQEVPQEYELAQNFPNPFNPETFIRFSLPQTEKVTLTIHNILGEKIATLIDGQILSPGTHTVRWNGQDEYGNTVATGIYIYSISMGHYSKSLKMILMK